MYRFSHSTASATVGRTESPFARREISIVPAGSGNSSGRPLVLRTEREEAPCRTGHGDVIGERDSQLKIHKVVGTVAPWCSACVQLLGDLVVERLHTNGLGPLTADSGSI